MGEINTGDHANSKSGITIECIKSWKRNDGEKGADFILNIVRGWSSISYGTNIFYEKIEILFNALLDKGRFFGGSVISFKSNPLAWKVDNISDDFWRKLLFQSKVFINRKEGFK